MNQYSNTPPTHPPTRLFDRTVNDGAIRESFTA
jgi:hypothetical protein